MLNKPRPLIIQEDIRQVTRSLMHRQSNDADFARECQPRDVEVILYDPSSGPACSVTDFRPDLVGEPDTAWNTSVIDVFVQHYTDVHPGADEKTVRQLFRGHLKYLCNQYKRSAHGTEAMENRQRAVDRVERQRIVSGTSGLLAA